MESVVRKINSVSALVFALILFGLTRQIFAQIDVSPPDLICIGPCETICIPVILDNPGGVPIDAIGMTILYPPDLLEFLNCDNSGTLTDGWFASNCNEIAPGIISIGGFNFTPITGSGILINVCFLVNDFAFGAVIEIADFIDDLAGATTHPGVINCIIDCFPGFGDGDINGDGELTPGDALCAFKTFLNGQEVPDECIASICAVCALYAADVNCDFTVTPGDALATFQRFLDGDPPAICFAQEGSILAKRNQRTEPYRLSLVQRTVLQSAEANDRDLIKLSLHVDRPEGLTAFGLGLSYPAEKLDFVGIRRTALTQEWIELDGQIAEPGELLIGGFNIDAVETVEAGHLFELTFASKGQSIAADEFGITELTDDLSDALLSAEASGLLGVATVPTAFKLYQSYPNPFQGHSAQDAVIRFDLAGSEAMRVELSIYNITGQLVRRLIAGSRTPGQYEISWDGRNDSGLQLPSGTYFYRLKAGDFVQSRYLSVVR